MTFHLQVQRILDTSSHCTVIDGAGEFHDGVKVKIADLHNLVEAHEAKLAALLEPGEYGGLLEMIEHEARIWPDSPLERLLRATAAAIEQLQAQKCFWQEDAKRYCENATYWRERAEQAEARLAECKEDAERYRWWRLHPRSYFVVTVPQNGKFVLKLEAINVQEWNTAYSPQNIDNAIDAARRKEST